MNIRLCRTVALLATLALFGALTLAAGVMVENKAGDPDKGETASAGEQINWQVLCGGGIDGSSASYRLSATVGQTAAGAGNSASYALTYGFRQFFGGGSGGCCIGLTGNVDNDPDELIDLGDLTALIDYLFISFTVPVCIEEANCDGDPAGLVDLGDLTAIIDYLFITFTPTAACL